MLEKQIEKKVCDYAKERGMLVYKFTSPNRMAVPDRLFICPDGRVFFIEFKREGQSPHQRRLGSMIDSRDTGSWCSWWTTWTVVAGSLIW
jgi:hypothetical protein